MKAVRLFVYPKHHSELLIAMKQVQSFSTVSYYKSMRIIKLFE